MRLDPHLERRMANHRPLTPLDFLDRAVHIFPERPAVVWRDCELTYGQFGALVSAMADFLSQQGVSSGDVVSLMCANRPEMLAAHYAVPLVGAVLNAINTRLDQATVGYVLGHSESRLLIADPVSYPIAAAAAAEHGVPVFRLSESGRADATADLHLLDMGGALPDDLLTNVIDEWQPICLNYTSGTTGKPKGVVYHHRGAYLNAIGNVFAMRFDHRTSYLWVLPMFHCSGWCHTWAITAAGGLHVCLDRVEPALIFSVIAERDITHMACAPVVLYMLLNHPDKLKRDPSRRITVATGGASPTSALIAEMYALGFDLIHLYGLTESFGPVTMRILSTHEAGLPATDKAALLARQGTRHLTANRLAVVDEHGCEVAHDGAAAGEILLRGNTLMMGYYRDAEATEQAFADGRFHTGDLAIVHAEGDIEIKDRSKDVIISGGENISSLELESVLHQHPGVLMAAVVAAPDPKWGEIPVAFIELRMGSTLEADEIGAFCRARLAGFKLPRRFLFRELPKTATGKIQKFLLREIARDSGDGDNAK
ncbi:AMP-binding protein [Rhizobium sp. KVB221]|uniref:3-methylmercaptopropionyl-CoA ligase n=1 Tax=Rhizobium setariae TaxID=2801340 RepID=A0A936YW29_9HYPH|nr:AMP-binding protein [Rhizobium setariae]MBL0374295.1 AMP-binding protein [Rhizobium setariae]